MNQPQSQQLAADAAAPDGIQVWVCPNCSNAWYSSLDQRDLGAIPNLRSSMRNSADEDPALKGSVVGYRGDCHQCQDSAAARSQGGPFRRQRVLYIKASLVKA